jgi:hypothetical protein
MEYDVAVIGGGASGLIAAGRASELGAKTILVEKNTAVGLKLLMTGGTRCNLTNYIEDKKILASNFGSAGRFLISAFSRFGPQETIDFFNALGLPTKIEENNRVFPRENTARAVLQALLNYLEKTDVVIKAGTAVREIVLNQGRIAEIILVDGQRIKATNYIITTGGRSYPATGSSGDAYNWLKNMGHKIITPSPALTPIIVNDNFVAELEGLSREGISLSLFQGRKKIAASQGSVLFTASGISGPAALDLSRFIRPPFQNNLILSLDFFPALSGENLDDKLSEIFSGNNKTFKNSLAGFLPPKLISPLARLLALDPEKLANSITKRERRELANRLKDFCLGVKGLAGYDKAMLTAGGLDLREVDPKTMRSRIIPNLFVAGEVLDIAGPTGGFNLQACWSTGRTAGEAAAEI